MSHTQAEEGAVCLGCGREHAERFPLEWFASEAGYWCPLCAQATGRSSLPDIEKNRLGLSRSGWSRINPHPSPTAVMWWFVKEYGDGYTYARGGRCATAREARRLQRRHEGLARLEHHAYVHRPTTWLQDDGSLTPIVETQAGSASQAWPPCRCGHSRGIHRIAANKNLPCFGGNHDGSPCPCEAYAPVVP